MYIVTLKKIFLEGDSILSTKELKTQGIISKIEETRRKLNCLMNQITPEVTEEALLISRELDALINDYYYNQILNKAKN